MRLFVGSLLLGLLGSAAATAALGCATGQVAGADGGGGAALTTSAPTCASVTCAADAACAVTGGVPVCTCKDGYKGDGKSCADVDECATGAASCGALMVCENTRGSYRCRCKDGYTSDGAGGCKNVDECSASPGPCDPHALCEDTVGAYRCACKAGYNGDGKTCTDIDECAAGAEVCAANATCTNAPAGSFTCTCKDGYEGDAKVACAEIDECARGTAGCSANATCANSPVGSFTCTCKDGYEGDGKTCTDIDECARGTATCPPGSTCTNSPAGAYSCTCGGATGACSVGAVSIERGAATAASATVTLALQEPSNLVTNPGAESGDLAGWSVAQSGGDGWSTVAEGVFGGRCFITSYGLCARSQTLDLLALGYTAAQLDAAPPITVREWVRGYNRRAAADSADPYYVKFELRRADGSVLRSFAPGTKAATVTWTPVEATFTGYGSGARKLYFEDGGQDVEYWAGHYGSVFDGASVVLGTVEFRASNDGASWSAWAPFQALAPWTLSAGTGTKTVRVEYRVNGLTWAAVSDTITR